MSLRRGSDRLGASLIEAVIAAGLLATVLGGVLPLVASAAVVVMTMRADQMAAHLARQRLAQLQALTHLRLPTAIVFDQTTRVDDGEIFALGGSGLGPSGAGPLEATTATWADWLDQRGVWIAAGVAQPDEARFRRRWGVLVAGANGCVRLWTEVTPLSGPMAAVRTTHAGTLRCPWGAGEP